MEPWHFAAFGNILIETFFPNLASLTRPSLQILDKTQAGYFQFPDFWSILYNCHNSKTSRDIDMKLGPVTKLDKRTTTTSKNLTMMSFQQIVTIFSFLQFMAKLQSSRSQILDAWSIKLIFSLIISFYLTKSETELKSC